MGSTVNTEPPTGSVSSYASLACGPPPCYARSGSSDSYEYVEKQEQQLRSSSPINHIDSTGFRGRGGRTVGGRYENSNERGSGGRGRAFRGGRERSGRGYERFSEGQPSQERFGNERGATSNGYESGEIQPLNRASSNPNRSEDQGGFEARGGRGGTINEGRGRGGRFYTNGGRDSGREGGRDGGRGGRGRGSGRFFERAGPGGRANFRGRGRGYEGGRDYEGSRDSFVGGGEWVGGDRSSADDSNLFQAGLDVGGRSETVAPRVDDRLPPQGQFSGRGRGGGGSRWPSRYDSFGTESEVSQGRFSDSNTDDRFGKRRREETPYAMDHDDKRSRENDPSPKDRDTSPAESARPVFTPKAFLPHTLTGVDSSNAEDKPVHNPQIIDFRSQDPRITGDPRGRIASQQVPDETRGGFPKTHDEPRGPLHRDDSRQGVASSWDDQRNSQPPSIDDDPRIRGSSQRDDVRSGHGMSVGDESRRVHVLTRDDPRESRPSAPQIGQIPSGYFDREDSRDGVRSQFHEEPLQTITSQRRDFRAEDPRSPRDSRKLSHVEDTSRVPPQNTRGIDDLYEDVQSLPIKVSDARPDLDANHSDRNERSFNAHGPGQQFSADSRQVRDQGSWKQLHGDESPRWDNSSNFESPAQGSFPNDSSLRSGDYSELDQPHQPYPRFPRPHQHLSLSSSKQRSAPFGNRSPMPSPSSRPVPSPGSGRRILPEDGLNFQDDDSGLPPPYNLERGGRGRGRGRGYRGRGRTDFGRFGDRVSTDGTRPQFTPRDGQELHLARLRTELKWQPRIEISSLEPGSNQGNTPIQEPGQRPLVQSLKDPPHPDHQQYDQASKAIKEEPSSGDVAKPDENSSAVINYPPMPAVVKIEEKSEEEKFKEGLEAALAPPLMGKPSGVMSAICRMVVLQDQMEFAYARHMLLVQRHEFIEHQTKVLQELPVGLEAIAEGLALLVKEAADMKEAAYQKEAAEKKEAASGQNESEVSSHS
jgi:hypothetical protein